jgi:hypothetical protein
MIGKVITGKSFGGCIRYVVEKQDAVVLDAAGVRMQQVNQIISDFNLQRKYNPSLGQAVGHIALSWSINDMEKLNDEVMVTIAKEYLQRMKIQDTQYLIVKHQDKEHPHIHIVYNRVNNDGKTIPDNFQKQRNAKVTKDLTLKHGFFLSPGKDNVNRKQLKGEDRIKYQLFDAITAAGRKVKNLAELKQVLAKQGIGLHFKYRSGTTEIQGISFSKGEHKFKGSEIDRSLSFAKLSQSIEAQQVPQEKSLADQLREIIKNNEQEQPVHQSPEAVTHYLKQAQGLESDYFGDLSIDIADDIDDEAIHGRNRHRKQQARTNSR